MSSLKSCELSHFFVQRLQRSKSALFDGCFQRSKSQDFTHDSQHRSVMYSISHDRLESDAEINADTVEMLKQDMKCTGLITKDVWDDAELRIEIQTHRFNPLTGILNRRATDHYTAIR